MSEVKNQTENRLVAENAARSAAAAPGDAWREPLAAILDMAEALDRAGLSHPQCDHVRTILDAALGLKIVLGGEEETAPAPGDAPVHEAEAVDGRAIALLEKTVGGETLIEILKSYLENAEKLCAELTEAAGREDWESAARLARDIAGSASGLGLKAVTTSARTLTAAAREGAGAGILRSQAEIIAGENIRARDALAALYPELAA
jgi:HPt (histidine-containing phosphotransfer) domain-containing protein